MSTTLRVTFVSIAVLIFVGIGVGAVQLAAPEDYKPSNLLKLQEKEAEQSSESSSQESSSKEASESDSSSSKEDASSQDQAQSLKADEEHDVVVIEECDLAVRYEKEIPRVMSENGEMTSTKLFSRTDSFSNYDLKPKVAVAIGQSFPFGPGFSGISIECYNETSFDEFKSVTYEYSDNTAKRFNFDKRDRLRDRLNEVNKEVLCQKIGLLEESCNNITNPNSITIANPEQTHDSYFFKYNGNSYFISESQLEDIQIQFNSLAPSEPSVELEEQLASSSQSSTDDDNNSSEDTSTQELSM